MYVPVLSCTVELDSPTPIHAIYSKNTHVVYDCMF